MILIEFSYFITHVGQESQASSWVEAWNSACLSSFAALAGAFPSSREKCPALYISKLRARQDQQSGGPGRSFPEILDLEELEECTRTGVALSLILLVAGSRKPSSDQYKQNKELSLVAEWARQE